MTSTELVDTIQQITWPTSHQTTSLISPHTLNLFIYNFAQCQTITQSYIAPTLATIALHIVIYYQCMFMRVLQSQQTHSLCTHKYKYYCFYNTSSQSRRSLLVFFPKSSDCRDGGEQMTKELLRCCCPRNSLGQMKQYFILAVGSSRTQRSLRVSLQIAK